MHQVRVAEQPIALTGAEFRVLELLMRSAGQVISRESMTEQALGRKLVPYDRSIDTHISNLRRKLDLEAGKNPEIKNVRGSGYTLTCAPLATRRMHSLFLRIFVLFWIAMALIVGGSIAVTFTVAAREYESRELQRRPAVAIRASEVLGKGGLPALKKWLSANEHSIPDRDLYIVGPDGRDILGRRLSDSAARRLEFFNRESMSDSEQADSPPPDRPPPGNFRPQRARAADRRARRRGLHRVAGAAPPEHLRRARACPESR